MTSRTAEIQAKYDQFKQDYRGACAFCDFIENSDDERVIAWHHYFAIIKNSYPYNIWDEIPVKRHFMIVPKRHVTSLARLNLDERAEYVRLLAEYEDAGFSIYSRAAQNKSRSIPHQHTHLIDVGA